MSVRTWEDKIGPCLPQSQLKQSDAGFREAAAFEGCWLETSCRCDGHQWMVLRWIHHVSQWENQEHKSQTKSIGRTGHDSTSPSTGTFWHPTRLLDHTPPEGWGRGGQRDHVWLRDQLNPRDMECGMKPKWRREVEANPGRGWVDHKWSHKTRGEFLGVDLEREIPRGEPDPLTR